MTSKYIVGKLPALFGLTIISGINYGISGFFTGLACSCAVIIIDTLTDGRLDDILLTVFFIGWAIFFANWFFDDIKKTVSLPLAYGCYRIAKVRCPQIIKDFLAGFESAATVFSKITQIFRGENTEVYESNRKRPNNGGNFVSVDRVEAYISPPNKKRGRIAPFRHIATPLKNNTKPISRKTRRKRTSQY